MTKRLLLTLAATLAVVGCDTATEVPPGGPPDGTATATLDGTTYEFRVYAQPSAYDPDEVVLRAYAAGLSRALMLTFEPGVGPVAVNVEMTGYWDLGLCTPSAAYVVAGPDDVNVHVTRNESGQLRGTFALEAESEDETGEVVTVTDGSFDVRLDDEPFEYCIEG